MPRKGKACPKLGKHGGIVTIDDSFFIFELLPLVSLTYLVLKEVLFKETVHSERITSKEGNVCE